MTCPSHKSEEGASHSFLFLDPPPSMRVEFLLGITRMIPIVAPDLVMMMGALLAWWCWGAAVVALLILTCRDQDFSHCCEKSTDCRVKDQSHSQPVERSTSPSDRYPTPEIAGPPADFDVALASGSGWRNSLGAQDRYSMPGYPLLQDSFGTDEPNDCLNQSLS